MTLETHGNPPEPSPDAAGSEAIAAALRDVRLFHGIKPRGLEFLVSIAREETHPEKAVIFREGEPGVRLYVILTGRVRISRTVSGMGEEALAVLGPGDSFGEMSIIDDVPRSADAIVHEPCRLLVVDKDKLEDLLFIQKELAYEILWNFVKILSARLRETNDKMIFLSTCGKF